MNEQTPVAWYYEARHIDSAWGRALTFHQPVEGPYCRNIKALYASPPPAPAGRVLSDVEQFIAPWKAFRFGVFREDGRFEELPESDPCGERHPRGHTSRWVGGPSDVALLRAALLAASAQPAEPAEPTDEFCWLVELFLPNGGNSLGYYHTGFTTLHGTSRSTKNVHEAKRYTTRNEAESVAAKLESLRGVWHAVEHGFAAQPSEKPAEPAPPQAPEEVARCMPQITGDQARAIARSAATSASDSASPIELVYAGWNAAIAALATQAEAVKVPAGWKLVPVEPTTEMVEAAKNGPADYHFRDIADQINAAYCRMLAAAPTPGKEGAYAPKAPGAEGGGE